MNSITDLLNGPRPWRYWYNN